MKAGRERSKSKRSIPEEQELRLRYACSTTDIETKRRTLD
jgi:hypothetical protein